MCPVAPPVSLMMCPVPGGLGRTLYCTVLYCTVQKMFKVYLQQFQLTPSLISITTQSDKKISNLVLGYIEMVSMMDRLNYAETMRCSCIRIRTRGGIYGQIYPYIPSGVLIQTLYHFNNH